MDSQLPPDPDFSTEPWSADEMATLDRLVDGEMSVQEQRDAVAWLDRQPGGWKRCGLAFLEAQSWARDMSFDVKSEGAQESADRRRETTVRPAGAIEQRFAADEPRVTRSTSRHSQWLAGGTLAAVVCLSFLAGRYDLVPWHSDDATESDRTGTALAPVEPATEGPDTETRQPPHALLVDDPLGRHETIEVPIYRYSDVGPDWLEPGPPTIPADVQEAVRSMGGDLRTERFIAPLRLQDGRRVLVPIERVEFVPPARRTVY